MRNRIQSVDILTTRFDPAEAEVTVTVVPDEPSPTGELRGRLMGPRTPYAETVEIAYPFRPMPGTDDLLRARVVIPEPNLWEPATPFRYEGPLELWANGQPIDSASVTHGLRQLLLRRKGLYVNGQPFKVQGAACKRLDEAEARHFHGTGGNLLVTPATLPVASVWDLADRYGFFVLGQLTGEEDAVLWHAEESLSRHTCCLGWLLPQQLLCHSQLWHHAMSLLHGQRKDVIIGIKVEDLPLGMLPGHVSFLVCEERLLPGLLEFSLPKLILTRRTSPDDVAGEDIPSSDFLGYVYRTLPSAAGA